MLISSFTVIPLADYYIIAGVIYQAPDLGSVVNSRVVSHTSEHVLITKELSVQFLGPVHPFYYESLSFFSLL